MDRERLPEQIAALGEIAEICDREGVDVVLIAGDVFDTYLPSAEAEDVFFSAVKRLAERGRAVVIVSGNHDDGVRLGAAQPLAEEQGIYIFGNRPRRVRCNSDRRVHPAESGEHYLVLACGDERVYINALPYPNEARFREEKTDESFSDRMRRWIARGDEGYDGKMPHILLSHLFVAGGRTSESERNIDLGGARAVPMNVLPDYGYVALGHLHRRQQLGNNVVYSGSILQYSFDETNTQKSVMLLTTTGSDISFREIPLTAGKKLLRLEATDVAGAIDLLGRYPDAFIELTLSLKQPLTAAETASLREANEGLVSLVIRVSTSGDAQSFVSRVRMGAEELFDAFYRTMYNDEASPEMKAAFLSLLEEEA